MFFKAKLMTDYIAKNFGGKSQKPTANLMNPVLANFFGLWSYSRKDLWDSQM
jgi:hypothetical protein